MQTVELHRGRLIDHIQIVVRDFQASRALYAAVFDALGVPLVDAGPGFCWADEFCITALDSEAALGKLTGRAHVAFQAGSRAMVEAVHAAALANGGRDNGSPGLRSYHPGYYAAFMLDPDGNNIEVVYHGEARRSAASVKIAFES